MKEEKKKKKKRMESELYKIKRELGVGGGEMEEDRWREKRNRGQKSTIVQQ